MSVDVSPNEIIKRLANKIGSLEVEKAALSVALEKAEAAMTLTNSVLGEIDEDRLEAMVKGPEISD